MNLFIHEILHFSLSCAIGFSLYLKNKKKGVKNLLIYLIVALAMGFFIDADHLVDYFLAFSFNFKLGYFLKGYQFLKTDHIVIPFHSFELAALFILGSFWLSGNRKKIRSLLSNILLVAGLSLFTHLLTDIAVNELPFQTYFLYHRTANNYELKTLVNESHYLKHAAMKKLIKL